MGHLAKNWKEDYILGSRAKTDRDIDLYCNLEVVELNENGLGKHWVLFSLAKDRLIAIQLD